MDIKYDYNIDNIIAHGIRDTESYIQATMKEATPLLPISIDVPDFGCSAFSIKGSSGDWLMGRNYDFKNNTSAMLLYCKPKKGYKSVALAALDDISVDAADESLKSKLSCLLSPFACLDGVNEKGVSICVLTLDIKPTAQDTGKEKIVTSLLIRLVLDKAASTSEAIELINK